MASAPCRNTLGHVRVSAPHVSYFREGCPLPSDSLRVSQHTQWKVAEKDLEEQPVSPRSRCG